ncbi:hypothetical protein G6F24_016986 [Rhizopus arrhizus]|nr:hypothetical protein G6F24_016986 [Rhizopus arrhizus]
MRVRGHPGFAHGFARERHVGAADAVKRLAVRVIAGRIPHRQAHGEQAVRRDEALDIVQAPDEIIDREPDIAPLRLFRVFAAADEIGIGAESNEVVGEQVAGSGVIHGLHVVGQFLEPGAHGGGVSGINRS